MAEPEPTPPLSLRARVLVLIGLLLLIAAHVLANVWWLSADGHPAVGDESVHLTATRYYYQALDRVIGAIASYDGGALARAAGALKHLSTVHPPLLYVLGAGHMTLFGCNPSVLVFFFTLCFAALIVGVYFLCTTFLTRPQALFATAATSLTPLLYAASRYYCLDSLGVLFVVWSLFALAKSDRFQRTAWVVLFAVFAAMGLLVKPTTLFFWIAPAIVEVARGLKAGIRIRLAAHLIVTGALTTLIAGPWYAGNLETLYQYWMQAPSHPAAFAFGHFAGFAYPFLVVNLGVFLPLFLLSVIGIALTVLLRRYRTPRGMTPMLCVVGAYVFMTLVVRLKSVRYIMPALPALSILAAMAILAIPWRKWRWAAGTTFLLLLLVQYAGLTFGLGMGTLELPWSRRWAVPAETVHYAGYGLPVYREALNLDAYCFTAPYSGDHYLSRAFRTIARDIRKRALPRHTFARLLVITNTDDVGGVGESVLYAPQPNPFALAHWRDEPVAQCPLAFLECRHAASPEKIGPTLPETDYLLCKLSPNTDATSWKACFERSGFILLDEFSDPGYGSVALPGNYLVMTRRG